MSYSTVGTIKSLNLSARTFTLEPISKYRFEVKDDDENSWKMIFKEENTEDADKDAEPTSLNLISQGVSFKFKEGLENAMVVLKQAKAKIKVIIDEAQLNNLLLAKSSADAVKTGDPTNVVDGGNAANAPKKNDDEERKVVIIEVL